MLIRRPVIRVGVAIALACGAGCGDESAPARVEKQARRQLSREAPPAGWVVRQRGSAETYAEERAAVIERLAATRASAAAAKTDPAAVAGPVAPDPTLAPEPSVAPPEGAQPDLAAAEPAEVPHEPLDASGAGGGLVGIVHSRSVGSATVRFWLRSAERIDRSLVEYAFDVSVQNRGTSSLQGAVMVSSSAAATQVVDSCALFGLTPAGLTRLAEGPFVIAQDRAAPFDPARLGFALAVSPDPSLCGDPGRVTLRRLNRSEYDNTVRDLLGTTQRPGLDFPADDFGYGFDNIGDVLAMSPLLFEKAEAAATKLVEEALRVYPASPAPVRFEAEDGDAECGGQSGSYWNLWSECGVTVEAPIELPGTYDVRVRAYQTAAGGEAARMQVRVDGAALGAEFSVTAGSGAPAVYTRTTSLGAGLHAVTVEFTNDYYEPPADRNLLVDWIELVGPIDPPPASPQITALRAMCSPVVDGRAACQRGLLAVFARRAWRRPPTTAEIESLGRLGDDVAAQGGSFDDGLALGMRTILSSPHFLFKVERDPYARSAEAHPLSDYELATRLSYFLWSSTPDDELLQLADEGRMHDPATIADQVRRMVQDPRALGFVESFAGQWLATRALDDVNPDYVYFPDWDEELKQAMRRETHLVFEELLRTPRSFLDLFDADFTYLNDRLATHYGLTPPGSDEPVRVPLSPSGQRSGIFTHASILSVTSQPRRTSPVKRGKWALDQLLCIDIPPPPAGVEGMLDQPGTPVGTLRERLEQHRANPECAACHNYLDPIGLGLENYDAIGAWRSHDNGEAVDASGQFPDGRTFAGPREMAALVKADPNTPRCIAQRLLIYALGRGLTPADEAHLDGIEQRFAAGGHRFESLLTAIAQSGAFRLRRGEPGGGTP